jgi:hypothetical protein
MGKYNELDGLKKWVKLLPLFVVIWLIKKDGLEFRLFRVKRSLE